MGWVEVVGDGMSGGGRGWDELVSDNAFVKNTKR